jgi:hypothetical protein
MMARLTAVWNVTLLLTVVVGCSEPVPGGDAGMDARVDTSGDTLQEDAPDDAADSTLKMPSTSRTTCRGTRAA